jgi:hypothetical protein
MVERPVRCSVPDNKHPCPLPAEPEIGQEAPNTRNRLSPTLPTRVGRVQIWSSVAMHIDSCLSVQVPVITLAEAPVSEDGHMPICERDARCFDGATKIGSEHALDTILASSCTEFDGKHATACGQLTIMPSGGNTMLVIFADRMRFEDKLRFH